MATGIGAVKQALVAKLRTISALTAEIGSGGIHEGVALRSTAYPYVVYQIAYSVRQYDWGRHGGMRIGVDIAVVSDDQVETHNLDQLIFAGLHEVELSISGQSTLICQRVSDLSFAGLTDDDKKVYQTGGTYTIWTDQAI